MEIKGEGREGKREEQKEKGQERGLVKHRIYVQLKASGISLMYHTYLSPT